MSFVSSETDTFTSGLYGFAEDEPSVSLSIPNGATSDPERDKSVVCRRRTRQVPCHKAGQIDRQTDIRPAATSRTRSCRFNCRIFVGTQATCRFNGPCPFIKKNKKTSSYARELSTHNQPKHDLFVYSKCISK